MIVDSESQQGAEHVSPNENGHPPARPVAARETAFGHPKDFLGNRFVYAVISPRARGLSIGVNLNPDKKCNFDCVYCEVNRSEPPRESHLDVDVMGAELKTTMAAVREGRLRAQPWYRTLPEQLLELRHVALSGDGEPTLAPNFAEAVETVIHVRAMGRFPFFKIVLITNATGLDRPQVQRGLKLFTSADEIWAKLDGGTQAYLDRVDRSDVPIEKILKNILTLARQRPVVIQSLFPSIDGEEPLSDEIDQYAERLRELKTGGAQIPLVQIYSATRPMPKPACGHLRLDTLSQIARRVREVAGLRTEVF